MPTNIPSGNAFLVGTPALDQLHNRLYAEQQQRQLQQRQDSKMLDEEFSRNLSNVRDIDIPEVTQKYSDYKQAWQNLYKKKGGGTPQDQLEVLKKKADMYSTLGASKNKRAELETAQKDIQKNPNNFLEGSHKTLIDYSKTPTSKLPDDIYSTILDNGYGTDFTKIKATSFGKQTERNSITQPTDNGASTTKTTYKGINPPSEIIQNLQGQVRGDRLTNHFIKQHDFTDEEANRIISDYTALKQKPEFKAAYPNEPEIPAYLLSTPLGKAMALTAMQQVVSNPPIAEVGKPTETIASKQNFILKKQAIGYQNSLAKMREYFSRVDASEINITKKAEELKNSIDATADANGIIKMDNEWKDKIFGATGGQVRRNANGDYERVVNNGTEQTPIWEVKATKPNDAVGYIIRGEVQRTAAKHTGGTESSNTISINDIPAGTKLEEKNGKHYYKGKEVI